MIEEDVVSLMYLVSRYLHVVATCLLVGGTLFYELIVPVAIDDLTDPVKLSVFARARWAFRWIVWCSAAVLLISGVVSSARNWYGYSDHDSMTQTFKQDPMLMHEGSLRGPGYWWLAHSLCGLVGVTIALILVKGRTPPRYPLAWMRINLLILMVAVFLASTTRHVRLRILESHFSTSGVRNVD
jgi:hypothetical protein